MNKTQLVYRCIFKDRHNFDIQQLEKIKEDDIFIYEILPYVARAFALSIVVLPDQLSIPAALGYCYCRILDTFEDMLVDPVMRRSALQITTRLLKKIIRGKNCNAELRKISMYETVLVKTKKKDETYCLLVREIHRINRVFSNQDDAVKKMIYVLVKKMSKGMIKNTGDYKENNENISDKKIRQYCKSVLGYPLLYICQLFQWYNGNPDYLHVKHKKEIIDFSQFIQLANITRDIEEDLLNNVVYHNLLLCYKNKEKRKNTEDPILKMHISHARRELMLKAITALDDSNYPILMKNYFSHSYGIRLSMLIFLGFSEIFYRNLYHKHYGKHDKCSTYVMIIKCILCSLCHATTDRAVKHSIENLNNLKKLLS